LSYSVDTIATKATKKVKTGSLEARIHSLLPSATTVVKIDNKIVHNGLTYEIYLRVGENKTIKCLQKKNRWDEITFSLIHWETTDRLVNTYRKSSKINILKLMHFLTV